MYKQFVILPAFLFLNLFSLFSHAAINELSWVGCGISKKAYMTELASVYEQQKSVHVDIKGGGATKGIYDVSKGEADLGGSCRFYLPGNDTEKSIFFEPVAWDALAVIVNKNNPVNNITFKQIRDIYTGKITNWKQLGGNDAPLKLYVREGYISGVGYTIRKLIFANPKQEFKASKEFKSSGPLEEGITQDVNSIAITGISSASLRDVKILTLDEKVPSYDNIKSGQYALYRPLFLTYNPESPNIAQIKDFIEFAHSSTGRNIMKKNGVVPYLEALRLVMKQAKQDQLAQQFSSQDITHK